MKAVTALTPGEWTPLKVEFKTPAALAEPAITFANRAMTDLPVWLDDVRLEELGPAP